MDDSVWVMDDFVWGKVTDWGARLIKHCRALADERVQLINRVAELEQQLVDKEDSIQWLKDQVDTLERRTE